MSLELRYINPFIKGANSILTSLGVKDIKKTKIVQKPSLTSKHPITVVVGLIGDIRGTITYNYNIENGKKFAGLMTMGEEVIEIDDLAKGVLLEIANMITGSALESFEEIGKNVDISTPVLIKGKNVMYWISQIDSTEIELSTSIGEISINVGIEV